MLGYWSEDITLRRSGQVRTNKKKHLSRDVTPFELIMKSAFGHFFKELGACPCFPELCRADLCGDASAMLRVRAALRHRWEEAH